MHISAPLNLTVLKFIYVIHLGRYSRPREQFLQIRTDLDLKVSEKFYFSLQPMFVEEGRVRVDVIQNARSIANQNKTFQHDF